jgi:hypothetical protein
VIKHIDEFVNATEKIEALAQRIDTSLYSTVLKAISSHNIGTIVDIKLYTEFGENNFIRLQRKQSSIHRYINKLAKGQNFSRFTMERKSLFSSRFGPQR